MLFVYVFTTNTWDFLYLLCSTDSEAYQYAYGTPMRQASGYSEVEIDPAATEDQPPMYDNTESSPQKAEGADDWQLVSFYEILLLLVSVKDAHGDILRTSIHKLDLSDLSNRWHLCLLQIVVVVYV